MKEPRWLRLPVVLAVHEAQLAEHGGATGIRDQGLLESALARPRQIYAYVDHADLTQLAAAYAIAFARNHAFVDGNKRTAWIVCATFLELNGKSVTAEQAEVVAMMLAVAENSITEDQFAEWLRRNCR